jgi:transcriptional regulator with XRE-family HTH domain
MIKNEQQYLVTKKQVAQFERALRDLDQQDLILEKVHPLLVQAQGEAIQSQLVDLKAQLEEYERLKTGDIAVLQINSIEELPVALIKARIAAGWSQVELAERLGMKKQQIQRYEATDYAGASLTVLQRVIEALGIGLREDVVLPVESMSVKAVMAHLRNLGFTPSFVKERLLSPSIRAEVEEVASVAKTGQAGLALRIASIASKILDTDVMTIMNKPEVELAPSGLGAVRFKRISNVDQRGMTAYSMYAKFLTQATLRATHGLDRQPIPIDALNLRKQIIDAHGQIDFPSALRFVWDLGIPVLPLRDPSAFHGATWRTDGRDAIVLKQRTQSHERWLVDLLHELRHAAEAPEEVDRVVIELEEIGVHQADTPEERRATAFASAVVLGGKQEALVRMCVEQANGSVERLKSVVPQVARQAEVGVGELANYLAFRLSLQGINWWGAANNLQRQNQDPWEVARDEFLRRVTFSSLEPFERDLLVRGLADSEE